MEKVISKPEFCGMFKKAVEDIKSAAEWGMATDELDYYVGTTADKWADKISQKFGIDFAYVSDLLYKEVRKTERI